MQNFDALFSPQTKWKSIRQSKSPKRLKQQQMLLNFCKPTTMESDNITPITETSSNNLLLSLIDLGKEYLLQSIGTSPIGLTSAEASLLSSIFSKDIHDLTTACSCIQIPNFEAKTIIGHCENDGSVFFVGTTGSVRVIGEKKKRGRKKKKNENESKISSRMIIHPTEIMGPIEFYKDIYFAATLEAISKLKTRDGERACKAIAKINNSSVILLSTTSGNVVGILSTTT